MENPIDGFIQNGKQVLELLALHREKNADKKTHHAHEILTKSCVVLLVACWEAFVEDAAEKSVQFLVEKLDVPSNLPKVLLRHIALELKSDSNDLKVWELSGDGWKAAVSGHYRAMLSKHLGPFNSPKAGNIDELYKRTLGLENFSSGWAWKGMSNKNAKQKLNELIELRGAIAHRVQTSKRVTRALADAYAVHLIFLAIKSSNSLRQHLKAAVGEFPWDEASYNSVR